MTREQLLAAIRLSLFRSSADWALVFERFGYSPRAWARRGARPTPS